MYHFFWSGPLSQWAPSPFVDFLGIQYNCAEQYMMAAKARLFQDDEILEQILRTEHPKEQKRLGRSVEGFNDLIWEAVCRDIVFTGNMLKFSQNATLREALLSTTGEIVEASPFDRVWGIGFDSVHAIGNEDLWGENRLGKILTQVRSVLRPV